MIRFHYHVTWSKTEPFLKVLTNSFIFVFFWLLALHWAVASSNTNAIRPLLKSGANLDAMNSEVCLEFFNYKLLSHLYPIPYLPEKFISLLVVVCFISFCITAFLTLFLYFHRFSPYLLFSLLFPAISQEYYPFPPVYHHSCYGGYGAVSFCAHLLYIYFDQRLYWFW